MAKKYNHAYTVAFAIESDNEDVDVTKEELLIGLTRRLLLFQTGGDSIVEACDAPYDTVEGFDDSYPDYPLNVRKPVGT